MNKIQYEWWPRLLHLIAMNYGELSFVEEYDTYQYKVYNFKLGRRKLPDNIYLPFKTIYKIEDREIRAYITVLNRV